MMFARSTSVINEGRPRQIWRPLRQQLENESLSSLSYYPESLMYVQHRMRLLNCQTPDINVRNGFKSCRG